MRIGRPIPPLTITDEERETLERWARRPTTGQAVAQRARLILSCAAGRTNTRVAHDLHLTKQTVGKWRTRFLGNRLDGLLDEPRPGAPRTVSDADVERVLTRTLETKPADATHWSIRSMAQACGLSRSTVNRIWRAFALQPHRTETFKLSNDPRFEEKFWDVIGLYLDPPERALVLCCDEKSQCQALERSQPGLPLGPRHPRTMTHDYKRHGTTTLFAALDYLEGKLIARTEARHTHVEWLRFLKQIERETPKGLDIHLIADNYATHKHPRVKAWLAKRPRFKMHFTPTSSSWLNLVERFFRDFTEDVIRSGSFASVQELVEDINAYLDERNANPRPYKWKAKGEAILEKIHRARAALDKAHAA